MISINNIQIFGWEAAIRGMRNPMNSWEKSDSPERTYMTTEGEVFVKKDFKVGPNDLELMKKLVAAGTDHSKFMRMIHVQMDITAPLYWVAEHDTYKIGTVRNSTSFMHKGTSKPFEIRDFSVQDKRIYNCLTPKARKQFSLKYPYETEEFKVYEMCNGRRFKVYKNGRVFREPFRYTDSKQRYREFEEIELIPSINSSGYFELNLGGRYGEKWLLHRLVAYMWIANENCLETVNHIDGDKGNNCVENLEWCSRSENIKKGSELSLFDTQSLFKSYIAWKNGYIHIDPLQKIQLKQMYKQGKKPKELSEIFDLPIKTVYNLLHMPISENTELYLSCYTWESIIKILNDLRDTYIETKDDIYFFAIRQLLPQGYNVKYTLDTNYEVLRRMYFARKDHKLDEWREFCEIMLNELPYFADLIGAENEQ